MVDYVPFVIQYSCLCWFSSPWPWCELSLIWQDADKPTKICNSFDFSSESCGNEPTKRETALFGVVESLDMSVLMLAATDDIVNMSFVGIWFRTERDPEVVRKMRSGKTRKRGLLMTMMFEYQHIFVFVERRVHDKLLCKVWRSTNISH